MADPRDTDTDTDSDSDTDTDTDSGTVDPHAYIAAVEHPGRRADAEALHALMARITGWESRMWGPSIIGFGSYRYRLANGREAESLATGFSPRTANTVLYVLSGDGHDDDLAILGKHKAGKGCLYVNRLADVDLDVLERIIRRGLDHLRAHHPVSAT